jgi:hypothetical protein
MADASFVSGQYLTAAALNAQINKIRTRRQQVAQTVNNTTTLTSSTYLTLPVEANKFYVFEATIIYTAATAADFRFALSLPTGSSMRLGTWTSGVTAGSGDFGAAIAHDAITTAFPMGGIGTAFNPMTARPTGVITIGANAGSCTVQFAQETANASDTTLNSQSWIRLTEVD